MSSKLTNETVAHVSTLARLSLAPNEIESLTQTLSAVLEHFEQIAKIDTAGIAPLVTPTDMTMSLRDDRVSETSTEENEQLLQNAPEKTGRLFKVPPVV